MFMRDLCVFIRNIPPIYPMMVVLTGLITVYVILLLNGIQSPMIEEFCRGAFYATLTILGVGSIGRSSPKGND